MSESGFNEKIMEVETRGNWIADWFRWCPTSDAQLEQAEKKLFSYVKKPYDTEFVPIKCDDGGKEECKIRTLVINKNANESSTPLVLLHGFASAIGLWVLNLDSLCQDRPVYAFDVLGFGRSSRPAFSKDAEMAENQLVDSIEEWRKQVELHKFILLGHSMGGFLAASYAIKYPDRVKHLILADPWGFPEPDLTVKKIEIPLWAKLIAFMLQPFNPLAGLRAAGPWGPQLVQRLRPDIVGKFAPVVAEPSHVSNYIYHCNAQTPSGEAAFKAMTARFGWAKRPMINRISQLRDDIPITFIYGSRSWIDHNSGLQTQAIRKSAQVEVKLIQGAGHHVYADRAVEFNKIVYNTCRKADKQESLPQEFVSIENIDSEERTFDDSVDQNSSDKKSHSPVVVE